MTSMATRKVERHEKSIVTNSNARSGRSREQRCGGEGEWASSAKRAREAGKSGERVGLWSEMQQRLSEGQRWRVKRADTVTVERVGLCYDQKPTGQGGNKPSGGQEGKPNRASHSYR